jgi:hypothetical protein
MAIGFTSWSFFKPSCSSLAMAFRCGSDVPEQMTKKSVKPEMPRRSMATIFSAFFSAA